ncbi:MAG TPA: plastocyanin/azurin family copper-binding protein [Actinomycetota bacterium]|jgi:plastocyanin
MARRNAIVMTAAILAALVVPAVPAAAGGGCHSGVTQGTGDTVELVDACFTPTTLQIQPGGSVTFVNTDPMVHNVGGNLWGHFDDLDPGQAFSATFDEPGVYPYACWYHPGMTGAIVVGDGTGVGNGESVTVASFQQPEPSPVVEIRTVTRQASSTPVVTGWVVGSLLGIGIGLGIATLVRRRSRPAA